MPYKIFNAPMPTTSVTAKVTTGSGAPKTMLQIAPTRNLLILAWGYTLDAVPASTGNTIELLQTDGAATVTAHASSGIYNQDPAGLASLLTLSTTGTGYTASGEGSITTTRVFDVDQIGNAAGANDLNRDYQFVLDERPVVAANKFLRIRVNFAAAVNMICWATVQEVG